LQEPIRVPSAAGTTLVADEMEDDVLSVRVTKLMQPGSSSSNVSESTAADAGDAGDGSVKTTSTGTAQRHVDDSSVDPLLQQGTASGLHQLSLYVHSCSTYSFDVSGIKQPRGGPKNWTVFEC